MSSSYNALFSQFQRLLFEECRVAGWDPGMRNSFGDEIAHIHEEISEAFRVYRREKNFLISIDAQGKPQGVPIEFADALIGMCYNAELYSFDLFAAVRQKHYYNLGRNYVDEGRQLHVPASGAPSNSLLELAAWCTKPSWPKWHYYINSASPFCGSLDYNLLRSDLEGVMVCKDLPSPPVFCKECHQQGVRARLW